MIIRQVLVSPTKQAASDLSPDSLTPLRPCLIANSISRIMCPTAPCNQELEASDRERTNLATRHEVTRRLALAGTAYSGVNKPIKPGAYLSVLSPPQSERASERDEVIKTDLLLNLLQSI